MNGGFLLLLNLLSFFDILLLTNTYISYRIYMKGTTRNSNDLLNGRYDMKKRKPNIVFVLLPVVLLICCVIGMMFAGIYFLKYEGVIPPEDHSALHSHNLSTHTITWKGKKYQLCDDNFYYDVKYNLGKAVTRCSECGDVLYEVSGDINHNFLVDPCFNERDDLYVSEDYVIPTEGKLTAVYVNGRKITNEKLLDAVEKLYSSDDSNFFLYKVKENFHHDYNIVAKKVNLSYEDCPVGSDYKGYIGKVDGKWCYFHDYPKYRVAQKETIPCFEIDEELIPIIDEYF